MAVVLCLFKIVLLQCIVIASAELNAMHEVRDCFNLSNYIDTGHHAPNISKFIKKREVDPSFRGHPKTKEEKWHLNFNSASYSGQSLYADRLVLLLNKVVTKYMSACASIIIYDQYVAQIDSIILQTFFMVIFIINHPYSNIICFI